MDRSSCTRTVRNIAHGNSISCRPYRPQIADYVVTEAGFRCRHGRREVLQHQVPGLGLVPDSAVLVCTVRAPKHDRTVRVPAGQTARPRLLAEDLDALEAGSPTSRSRTTTCGPSACPSWSDQRHRHRLSSEHALSRTRASGGSVPGCDAPDAPGWRRGGVNSRRPSRGVRVAHCYSA